MQFALCQASAENLRAASEYIENGPLRWLRFGNEYFCYGGEPEFGAAAARLDAARLSLRPLPASAGGAPVEDGSLHLVLQENSLFRRAHPDVPVLLDRGRHMLVALAPARAERMAQHEAQFAVRPVAGGEVVFEVAPRPDSAPVADARTRQAVRTLSRARYANILGEIASYPARHSLSSHFHDAARRARDCLEMMGYDVRVEDVDVAGGTTFNVVAEKRPAAVGDSARIAVVTAHLDTVHHRAGAAQADDPTAPAPGVNDNGSGSAGVLEMARVFKDQPLRQGLRFILFGGQEQGLCGSRQYVAQLDMEERARISAVVNMDMIGVLRTSDPTVLLEGGATVSRQIISRLALAAHTYTGLKVHTSYHYHSSDHVSFIDADVPAVLTIEGSDGATSAAFAPRDTLNSIDYDYALEILRMNTAYLMHEVAA